LLTHCYKLTAFLVSMLILPQKWCSDFNFKNMVLFSLQLFYNKQLIIVNYIFRLSAITNTLENIIYLGIYHWEIGFSDSIWEISHLSLFTYL
jgi:hypothetical protein